MTFFVRPIIRPQRIFAKMMGVGGRGGGGPKFVYPEMADDFIVENEKFWYS